MDTEFEQDQESRNNSIEFRRDADNFYKWKNNQNDRSATPMEPESKTVHSPMAVLTDGGTSIQGSTGKLAVILCVNGVGFNASISGTLQDKIT